MSSFINKAGAKIRSEKGETLIESLCSLLILAVLLLAVTAVLQAALRITRDSVDKAEEIQNTLVNPAVLEEYTNSGEITFSGGGITARHRVYFTDDDGILAFSPEE